MAKQTKKQAVEQRTQQRLAARKEAIQKGVQTRRRNREARKEAPVAAQAAEPQQGQAQAVGGQTKRPEGAGTHKGSARPGGPASEAMATVALRGESAQRFRALAAKHEMSLTKLLLRMMEVFETATK